MGAIISMMISFVTVYLIYQIGRWFILPDLFGEGLEPLVVTQTLWWLLNFALNGIFFSIIAVITVIFIIWWIIKTFVPELFIFFPLRSMLLGLTPFPPMTSAGILPLWEDLANILSSGDSIKNRVIATARAVANFLARGVGFLGITTPQGVKLVPPVSMVKALTGAPKPPPPPPPPPPPDKMTPEQRRILDEEYQQCIEEQSKPLPKNMTAFDRLNVMLENSTISVKCGMNKLNTTAKLAA